MEDHGVRGAGASPIISQKWSPAHGIRQAEIPEPCIGSVSQQKAHKKAQQCHHNLLVLFQSASSTSEHIQNISSDMLSDCDPHQLRLFPCQKRQSAKAPSKQSKAAPNQI